MALAYLCKDLVDKGILPSLTLRAFIIDHKARPESTEEAHKVSTWLHDIGIYPLPDQKVYTLTNCLGLSTTILTLKWPDGVRPLKLTNFETVAREARYQSLSSALASHGLDGLVMGHHQDDQVETILFRLLRDGLGGFSSGLDSYTTIPETTSPWGIHRGGSSSPLGSLLPLSVNASQLPRHTWPANRQSLCFDDLRGRIQVACRGKLVLRPLLPFPKNRIIATCESNKIEFVTDPTNLDVTYTPRNAIRHIRSHFSLPKALSKPSVLATNRKARRTREALIQRSNELLSAIRILHLDLRTGTLCIALPKNPPQKIFPTNARSSGSQCEDRFQQIEERAVAKTVSRLMEVVVRRKSAIVHPYSLSLRRFWGLPWLDIPSTESQPGVMTIGKVQFVKKPLSNLPLQLHSKIVPSSRWPMFFDKGPAKQDGKDAPIALNLDDYQIWTLHRRPFRKLSRDVSREPSTTHKFALAAAREMTDLLGEESPWSEWHSWDRFWIRLSTPDPAHLSDFGVRPLQLNDMQGIDKRFRQMSKRHLEGFRLALKQHAPGKIRYTLPVIVDKEDQVLALPTLGFRVDEISAEKKQRFVWQVRYQWIDPEVLKLATGAILPGDISGPSDEVPLS